ncbi:MAG: hypothetical protein ABW140_10725 [Candidatus Sedimenticola sp. 6PFRAG1]
MVAKVTKLRLLNAWGKNTKTEIRFFPIDINRSRITTFIIPPLPEGVVTPEFIVNKIEKRPRRSQVLPPDKNEDAIFTEWGNSLDRMGIHGFI